MTMVRHWTCRPERLWILHPQRCSKPRWGFDVVLSNLIYVVLPGQGGWARSPSDLN